MEPITREEYYLAKIAGTYEGNTPEPVTIEEYYLATMAGDYSGNTPQPVTRLQYYMAKVAGVWGGSIPAPVTRLEYYWAAIASGEGKVFPPVTREEHFLVLVADAYSVVLTVVTGNPALLENSKGNRGLESLTLYGKSTQVSTTGAQLFDVSEVLDETALSTEKPVVENAVGYWTSGYIPVKTGNYICSPKGTARGWVYDADKNGLRYINNAGGSQISIKEGEAFVRVSGKYPDDPQNFMFNEGDSIKPYEPYTGGKPSPSPEYPQEIKSAGDGGSVTVKVTGKNLFPVVTSANLSKINKPDGGVRYGYVFYVPVGSSVAASGNANVYTNCYVGDFDIKTQTYTQKALLVSEKGVANAITLQSGWYVIYAANDYLPSILIKLNGAKIQLEIGAEATAYEPYKPAQKLIIPTPNGLPGIPVSSGGNYTDEKGQQWVADEIDLAKGERVQWTGEYRFTGAEAWNSWGVNKYTEGITGFYWYFKNTLSIAQMRILNTHAVFSENAWGGREEGAEAIVDSGDDDYLVWSVRNEYLEDTSDNNVAIKSFKKMLGEINAKMLCCLAEPIRTPLSPETIAAYKALRTYSPTTTVINDADAWMSVGYAKMK